MPLTDKDTAEAFKRNIQEFMHNHKFSPGMTPEEKDKQSVAVAYAIRRKARIKRIKKHIRGGE